MSARHLPLALLVALVGCRSPADEPQRGSVRFAVISDIHHGLAPDALERLESFVAAVNARAEDVDFAIQLGDFCLAQEGAEACTEAWNRLAVPAYHVLGNHDMDLTDRDGAMELFGMESSTYSFDVAGWHFVALDLNHLKTGEERVPYANSNYYVDAERRAWAGTEDLHRLRADLASTDRPTITFSHQPLGMTFEGDEVPPQQEEVFDVLLDPESAPVVACVSGHLHTDRLTWHADVACLSINSASYFWSRGMVPYRDPVFAFVTLTPDGSVHVEGVESEWSAEESVLAELPRTIPGMRPGIVERSFRLRRLP